MSFIVTLSIVSNEFKRRFFLSPSFRTGPCVLWGFTLKCLGFLFGFFLVCVQRPTIVQSDRLKRLGRQPILYHFFVIFFSRSLIIIDISGVRFTVAPVCRPGQETVQGVGRLETAKVLCEVEANPSDNVQYSWRFNNSLQTVNLERDQYTEEGSRSTASYTPLRPLDYGTLMCWASNEYGKQFEPCVYQVIAAGK